MTTATERQYLERYRRAAQRQEKFYDSLPMQTADGKPNTWFWLPVLVGAFLLGVFYQKKQT